MSAWLLVAREVYKAGGRTTAARLSCSLADIANARRKGVLEKPGVHGRQVENVVALSALGWALCEGRAEFYVPPFTSSNEGRAPGTHRRVRATWLASLPQENAVRLTRAVHPAQNDGTCYW